MALVFASDLLLIKLGTILIIFSFPGFSYKHYWGVLSIGQGGVGD